MHFALDENQRTFKERFDAICREQIALRARDVDRRGCISANSWNDLARAGYLRLFHAPSWGGTGADGLMQGLAMESLAQACAGTFWATSISTVLCGKLLHDIGTPSHHWDWLQKLVAGQKIGCFAATENGAGSDPNAYQTMVRETKSGLRLVGEKSRISNACTAHVAIVLARNATSSGPGLCYVVTNLEQRGIDRHEMPKLGLCGMSWGTIAFDDVPIAREDVIFHATMDKTLRSVEWGQLIQTWCSIGLARAALEACLDYAGKRNAFGRPIAHLELVHTRIADMHAEIDAARLLALECSWLKGQGRSARDEVMMAKIYATEMAVRVVDMAMRLFAGWGYAKDHIIERLYRDSLANVPAGLPTDRLREFLACAMLGADPWTYAPFDWRCVDGGRLVG
jgi:alkylation response protein AidB-like acyl-CoA dehydrogenase